MPVSQFGTIYVWKGASGGDWNDNVHNWTPGYPIASPPSYGDLAIFNDGGADLVAGNGSASELDVVLGTTLTIQDSVSTDGAVTGVGLMVDSGGRVIVGAGATKPGVPSSPGTVSVDVIGFTGIGALDVTGGGGVDDTGLVLGDRAGSAGTLTVDGVGSQVIVAPASAPNGTLIVGNGGAGTVIVRNGGSLSAVVGAVVGFAVGSSGTATVTGSGSSFFASSFTDGQGGGGQVTVTDGGVLTTFTTSIGGGGVLDVTSTLPGNAGTVIAINTMTMSGGTLDVTQGGVAVVSVSLATGPAGAVLIDAGHALTGLGTLNGNVVVNNLGALVATGATAGVPSLRVNGDISGGGTIEPLMTLDLNGAVAPAVQVVFHDSTLLEPGILVLENAAAEGGTINGFAVGNEVLIPGASFAHALFNAGSLTSPGTLILSGGAGAPLSLAVAGIYTPNNFLATSDSSGTTVTLVACFMAGTRIATTMGDVAVERLAIGMHVLTDDAGSMPVEWIGHRDIDCASHPEPIQVWPVCVRAGAFGNGVPVRDLWLSPDHAVFVDGVLIPVKHLINRTSIVQMPRALVSYYHVELPRHAVILAEGLTVESYLDTGDRRLFAKGGAATGPRRGSAAWIWETESCAELVQSGAIPREVRRALAGVGHGPGSSTA